MRTYPLLPGERILWDARPGWLAVARSVFFIRPVALYFAMLLFANAVAGAVHGAPAARLVRSDASLALIAGATCGILLLLSWLTARTTSYSLTTRRLVLRYGIAFPATLSLPLRVIGSVAAGMYGRSYGDIRLTLRPGEQIGFLKLWPFVNPWHLSRAEPVLRAVPAAGMAATLLSRTLEAAQCEALSSMDTEKNAACAGAAGPLASFPR